MNYPNPLKNESFGNFPMLLAPMRTTQIAPVAVCFKLRKPAEYRIKFHLVGQMLFVVAILHDGVA
jgi:hypothetical protein